MTVFTRDFSHRIALCVLWSLFFFQLLPYVTCQKESESNVAESAIGIVLLSMFLVSIVGCGLFYACRSTDIETRGREVLHTRARHGLDKEIIESFPIFQYSEVKGLKIGKGGVECAICLSDFEDEETLRWMPPCSHTFQAKCIDVWLSSWNTCPVCRANLSLKSGERFPYPSMDLETGNAQRCVLESPDDISNSVTCNNNANYTTPRSRSTGLLSSWRMAEIFVPRSHSTGHSVVQLGENLAGVRDRATGAAVLGARKAVSLRDDKHLGGPYLSFQAASARSTLGKDVRETSQATDRDSGERSFERLMPEKV